MFRIKKIPATSFYILAQNALQSAFHQRNCVEFLHPSFKLNLLLIVIKMLSSTDGV